MWRCFLLMFVSSLTAVAVAWDIQSLPYVLYKHMDVGWPRSKDNSAVVFRHDI